ncbi:hypothetical protein MRX96_022558 [Rhipicephalus microplus]
MAERTAFRKPYRSRIYTETRLNIAIKTRFTDETGCFADSFGRLNGGTDIVRLRWRPRMRRGQFSRQLSANGDDGKQLRKENRVYGSRGDGDSGRKHVAATFHGPALRNLNQRRSTQICTRGCKFQQDS